MKKYAMLLIVAGSLLSGCVAYDHPNRDGSPHSVDRDRDRDGVADRSDRDRDGDGVPNRMDRRPSDRDRY